jgi:hypothetical protein
MEAEMVEVSRCCVDSERGGAAVNGKGEREASEVRPACDVQPCRPCARCHVTRSHRSAPPEAVHRVQHAARALLARCSRRLSAFLCSAAHTRSLLHAPARERAACRTTSRAMHANGGSAGGGGASADGRFPSLPPAQAALAAGQRAAAVAAQMQAGASRGPPPAPRQLGAPPPVPPRLPYPQAPAPKARPSRARRASRRDGVTTPGSAAW